VKDVVAKILEGFLMVLVIAKEMAVILRAALVVPAVRAETVQPATIESTLYVYLFFIDRREII
jgi:hypothetical protein